MITRRTTATTLLASRRRARQRLTWLQRLTATLGAGACLVVTGAAGPFFDIILLSTPQAPTAKGSARLVFAESPFGIAVTADGRASYDVQVTASGLPDAGRLGAFSSYVAWEVSTDLKQWHRLGAVANGTTTVGRAEMNKFILVIAAEPSASPSAHVGPTVLHGISPSGWIQSFLTHPLFRGIPP